LSRPPPQKRRFKSQPTSESEATAPKKTGQASTDLTAGRCPESDSASTNRAQRAGSCPQNDSSRINQPQRAGRCRHRQHWPRGAPASAPALRLLPLAAQRRRRQDPRSCCRCHHSATRMANPGPRAPTRASACTCIALARRRRKTCSTGQHVSSGQALTGTCSSRSAPPHDACKGPGAAKKAPLMEPRQAPTNAVAHPKMRPTPKGAALGVPATHPVPRGGA
jgi:hypothetical protein